MAKTTRPSTPVLILIAMVLVAIALAITKFHLPGLPFSWPTDQGLSKNSSTLTNRSANTNMKTYTFPGQLPAEQIHAQQAKVVTNKGTIIFRLDDAAAPLAVSSFIFLAKQGYFDGLLWHRVIPDFVIQGGDPTGTGGGGPGYTFPDEPVVGEYVEGTVAMANAGPDTNGSQFFITNADGTAKLAKNYTIFGHVTSGLNVVKSIVQGDQMTTVAIEPAS